MEERISANHMEHSGKAFKSPEELKLEDFIPGKDEMELLFCHLVPMYSAVLLNRHPLLYKSLKGAIKDHVPHQFQSEMDKKSTEYTGKIYEKSENKSEDLISMIEDYQNTMVVKSNDNDHKTIYHRQLTGDQKTEKNTHFAILRYSTSSYFMAMVNSFALSLIQECT